MIPFWTRLQQYFLWLDIFENFSNPISINKSVTMWWICKNCHSIYIRNVYIYAICLECALTIRRPSWQLQKHLLCKECMYFCKCLLNIIVRVLSMRHHWLRWQMLQQVPLAVCPTFPILLCLVSLLLSYELPVDFCEIFIDVLQGLYSLRRQHLNLNLWGTW